MKLRKWIKQLDPIVDVVLYTQYSNEDDPAYEGTLLDVPWYFIDMEIGREDKDESNDPPIYISKKEKTYPNGDKRIIPIIVINLIEK